MELSNPKIKKVLVFFTKKAFLVFQETELFKRNFSNFTKELQSLENKKTALKQNFLTLRIENFKR